MAVLSKFVIPGIVFVVTVAFGLWLSRSGKPYNGLLFNAHKLIALAAVITAALQTFNALKIVELQPLLIALLVLVGLSVVALFVTGALMSANKPAHNMLLIIHKLALFLVLFVGAAAIYLLAGRTS